MNLEIMVLTDLQHLCTHVTMNKLPRRPLAAITVVYFGMIYLSILDLDMVWG